MKVILLKDINKLGKKFDTKDVSSGHAINFLIPNGLAVAATAESMKHFELERAKIEGERKVQNELLSENIKSLDSITLNVSGKANDKGHLFAGIHREEIVKELEKQMHLSIDPASIVLEHPLKEVGEHTVEVKVEGKSTKFKIIINPA
jgi:large subunit ribosomal protein L9